MHQQRLQQLPVTTAIAIRLSMVEAVTRLVMMPRLRLMLVSELIEQSIAPQSLQPDWRQR